MRAQYRTRCPVCQNHITPGSEISRTDAGHWAHESCVQWKRAAEHDAAMQRIAEAAARRAAEERSPAPEWWDGPLPQDYVDRRFAEIERLLDQPTLD